TNAGPTQPFAPLPGSPAFDAGAGQFVSVVSDQRGAPRIKGIAVDIGAFESGPSSLVITTLADSAGPGLTLRAAIEYVNTIDPLGGVTITFAPGLQGPIALTQGLLPATAGALSILGPRAD